MKKIVIFLICMILFITGCGNTGTSNNVTEKDNNDATQNSEITTEGQTEIIESEIDVDESESQESSETEPVEEEKPCNHSYSEATCAEPAKCKLCGIVKGNALGHDVKNADCTNESKCKRCGKKIGGVNGHAYMAATCTKPQTCSVCGDTKGNALGHSYTEATCTEAAKCKVCGTTGSNALGHSYSKATCTSPEKCKNCGIEKGNALGHTEVVDAAVEATHSSTGLTEGKHCSACGTILVAQETTPKRSAAANSTVTEYHGGGLNGTYKTYSTSGGTVYNEWIIEDVVIVKEDTSNGKFKMTVTITAKIVNQTAGCPDTIKAEYLFVKNGKNTAGGGRFVKTNCQEGVSYQITFTEYGFEEADYKLTFSSIR